VSRGSSVRPVRAEEWAIGVVCGSSDTVRSVIFIIVIIIIVVGVAVGVAGVDDTCWSSTCPS
jgi:hypothetical protein